MTLKPIFLLDANVFIEAARRYYAFDLAPVFWEQLIIHAKEGRILSIDRVQEELKRGKDDLAEWATMDFNHAFLTTDKTDIMNIYGDVMAWVNSQNQFSVAAKSEFAKGADGWLVAYAKLNKNIIVTHEEFSADVKRKVPIPNICRVFDVPPVDTFVMLRKLGIQFT